MGEAKLEPFRVDFDRRVTLEFRGRHISSDADDPVMHAMILALA